ncbi:MAG: ABC transporter substrate-binding protein [Actinomycetaceae bacterium]|nr:ABC transporter substrate-binding protein [Actinomycetaceae bacterium]
MRKKMAILAAFSIAALGLTACGDSGAGGGEGGQDLVAVIAKGYASPFWATVKKGAEDAGKEAGVTVDFRGPDTESDVNKQVDQLNQALVKNPKALVFAALDSEAEATALEQYRQKEIPVVAFDSGVPGSDIPVTTVATDNKAAGAEAAKKLAEAMDNKGEVAIVCHSQTSVTGTDRRDGFKEEIEKNYPDIKVVDVQYNDSDQAKAQQQTDAIISGHPELKGLYATDDDGAVGAANVVKQKGMVGKILVVGFDSGKDQLDRIRNGEIFGSVTQNPYKMGYDAVMLAVDLIKDKNKKVDEFVDSGFHWYDKDNMDDEEIKKALYE